MEPSRLTYLTERFLSRAATTEETREFFDALSSTQHDSAVKEVLAKGWLEFSTEGEMPLREADKMFNAILRDAEGLHSEPAKLVFFRNWRRIAAAAAILVILSTGTYFLLNRRTEQQVIVNTLEAIKDFKPPTSTKATLTLANGNKIGLDSAVNGTVAVQGGVQIIKLADGEVTYSGTSNEVMYNIVSNPRGSKVANITLADGSKVWLNAGSSITYPTAFTGNERLVQIAGEAYFEVAKDPSKTFVVTAGNCRTEVLGTHFNVNAYGDENDIKVTLLEGSIRVSNPNAAAVLNPANQAQVSGEIKVVDNANVEQVMAWKNGLFHFCGADIEEVMRMIGRWYNVDVVYEKQPASQHFRGEITRESEASKVFRMLEATGTVKFRMEGNKVYVLTTTNQ